MSALDSVLEYKKEHEIPDHKSAEYADFTQAAFVKKAPRKKSSPAAQVLNINIVGKTFQLNGKQLRVLQDINFAVYEQEFVAVVGSSGCGKSTLLLLTVGLDKEFEGSIVWQGKEVSGTSLDRGIVFQEHRLFPWLTVKENIALALESTQLSKDEREQRVIQQLETVGLKDFEHAYPHQISGGMAQRAAIARALVLRPSLLLLDEPFGALDALTRLKMQQELQRLCKQYGTTTILVTHDVEEAVFLANRIVVMESNPGRVKRIVEVPLDGTRNRASVEFQQIKQDVLSDFI